MTYELHVYLLGLSFFLDVLEHYKIVFINVFIIKDLLLNASFIIESISIFNFYCIVENSKFCCNIFYEWQLYTTKY